MTITRRHRRAAVGHAGYVQWSMLGGAVALRIPWIDLLKRGRCDSEHLARVRLDIEAFERELEISSLDVDATIPGLPTPGAKMIRQEVDLEFERELAERREVYSGGKS